MASRCRTCYPRAGSCAACSPIPLRTWYLLSPCLRGVPMTRLRLFTLFTGLGLAALCLPGDRAGRAADSKAPDPAAVARARKTVDMLDHVYKTTVVLITDKYV